VRGPLFALLFLAWPLVEIAGFVAVGRQVGVFATIGLVLLSAVAGAFLLRFQGFGAVTRIRRALDAGGDPSRDLAHGAMIMLAGILLLLPGFFTDIIGLLLFIPPVRDFAWRTLRRRVTVSANFGVFGAGFQRPGGGSRSRTIDLDADEYAETKPRERRRELDEKL
jgi:UPF0716 protein FxsA